MSRELSNLGIPLNSPAYHPAPEPTGAASDHIPGSPFYGAQGLPGFPGRPISSPADYLFQSQGGIDTVEPDPMAMEPGLFEAMSSLEPLSAWVGTIPKFEAPEPS